MASSTNNNEIVVQIEKVEDSQIRAQNEKLETARSAFDSGKTLPISFRRTQLKNMMRMLQDNKEDIYKALHEDLRKPKVESEISEIEVLRVELNTLLRNLKNYSKRDYISINLGVPGDDAYTQNEPFGVVLVIGAWNFPFMTTLQPVCGAIAAGNCTIIKPSELAPKCAKLMSDLVGKYLDKSCYQVIEADVEQTKALLKNKFDFICATGSINVGKAIMAAAALHLTPVCLELGGKSPVYIDDSCESNIRIVAKRLLWGKLYNLGQCCVSPDYVLCSKKIQQLFLNEVKDLLKEWYGENIKASPNLARIINERHFYRIKQIIDTTEGKKVFGGQLDESEKWISPTIYVDVSENDVLMKDEIFGPILPFVTIDNPKSAISFINARPKPLALYIFSRKNNITKMIINKTSSGSVCVNDVVLQVTRDDLPFGGVGDSGIGRYHGKYTFETFSHKKSVLWRPLTCFDERFIAMNLRYPPFNNKHLVKLMKLGTRHFHLLNVNFWKLSSYFITFVFGALLLFLLFFFRVIRV